MADIICVIGSKGGTGRTTLSHMLCQGLGLLGQRSICVLTDARREAPSPAGRRYQVAAAHSHEALDQVADEIRSLQAWMGVIDGGGAELDRKLYGLADLVLLPFRDSHEDIRAVARDLDRFTHAYAIPAQWPSNAWQREAADKAMDDMLAPYRDRVLRPVLSVSASKLLLQKDVPDALPTPLANAARGVAMQVLTLLQISIEGPARAARAAPAALFAQPAMAA
jgi:hypothetical protein